MTKITNDALGKYVLVADVLDDLVNGEPSQAFWQAHKEANEDLLEAAGEFVPKTLRVACTFFNEGDELLRGVKINEEDIEVEETDDALEDIKHAKEYLQEALDGFDEHETDEQLKRDTRIVLKYLVQAQQKLNV
jgi:hypothetical protein